MNQKIISVISFVVGIAVGGIISRFITGMVRVLVGIALLVVDAWRGGLVGKVCLGASSVLLAGEINRLVNTIRF